MLAQNRLFGNQIKTLCRKSKRLTSKIAVEVNENVLKNLENNEYKARYHPGICRTGNLALPKNVIIGIKRCVGDYPVKSLLKDGQALNKYFHARHPPTESNELKIKMKAIEEEINEKHPLPDLDKLVENQKEKLQYNRQKMLQKILKQRVFGWRPMNYGAYESLVYAVGRSAKEYAILFKIFTEISKRDTAFKPRSYFDFGSGVGSAMWAASSLWINSIYEYYNVDSSSHMNDLSDLILREGSENKLPNLRNVFYRQFLPATPSKYDLVISAFTLFELPNEQSRKENILNLWKKCDGYMVIVEDGSRCGFKLVNEIRNFILSLKETDEVGHVFAPCSHDLTCPRLANDSDTTPCNFEVSFACLGIGEQPSNNQTAKYSYVVLKKGLHDKNEERWPRIVRPTLVRSKHTICRMCTNIGTLQEVIFSQSKHGKFAYRCARSSRWGDRLPIKVGLPFSDKKNLVKDNEN